MTCAAEGTANIWMISVVSGGFAIVQPNSSLSLNAVEGYPLEDFSAEVSDSRVVIDQHSIADMESGCSVTNYGSTKNHQRKWKSTGY